MKIFSVLLSAFVFISFWNCSSNPESGPDEIIIESIPSAPGEKILLRVNPTLGEVQKMKMTMEMSSEGTPQMESVLNTDIDLEAVSANEGIYTFSLQYNSMKFSTDTGGISFSYDSDAETQSGMGAMYDSQIKRFIGKPLRMKMDEMGKVIEFTLPGEGSTEQFGDMASMAIPFPRDPVGVGDSWSAERTADGIGVLHMDMSLDKMTASEVIIKTHGIISGRDESERGEFSGEYRVDRKSGMTVEGIINMETALENQPVRMKLSFKSQ